MFLDKLFRKKTDTESVKDSEVVQNESADADEMEPEYEPPVLMEVLALPDDKAMRRRQIAEQNMKVLRQYGYHKHKSGELI